MDEIQIIVLVNGLTIISKVSQVISDLGEPDCKLSNPYLILSDGSLEKWLSNITDTTDSIMISSDKILTLVDPKNSLLSEYLEIIS